MLAFRLRGFGLTLGLARASMHGVAPQMCRRAASPLLGRGAGGRSPGFFMERSRPVGLREAPLRAPALGPELGSARRALSGYPSNGPLFSPALRRLVSGSGGLTRQFDRLDDRRIIIFRLLTRVEIGHIRIGPAKKGRVKSLGSGSIYRAKMLVQIYEIVSPDEARALGEIGVD